MKKIYIIDDETEITDSLAMILEGEGYVTAKQNDVTNAVENIAGFQPDLIMLDVMFPDHHSAGFELARQIRKDKRLAKTPILMLSAINKALFQQGAFSNKDRDDSWMPVDQFVDKPINPRILIDKVSELIEGAAK